MKRAWPILAFTLTLVPPARGGGEPAFPEIDVLRPNVAFWRDVYSRWSMGQVVVHDTDCLGLVYEQVGLPGEIEEAYTEDQREFIATLRAAWKKELDLLAETLRTGAELGPADRELALRITTECGTGAIDGAASRVRVQRGLRERFKRGLEIGARYDALLRQIFHEAGLPDDLALLPHVESSFQSHARSSAGALGAWQFTRGTGRRYLRIDGVIDERLDPVLAARGAARLLAEAHAELGSWPMAITAYNHGMAGMLRARQEVGEDFGRVVVEYGGPAFGFASRNFYAEFLAAREIALEPERFFPEGLSPEVPLALEQARLDRPSSPRQIATRFGVDLEDLVAANPAWTTRARHRGFKLPAGSPVWIPNRAEPARAAAAAPAALASAHVVRPGENLWSIAERYGIDLARLRSLNGMGPNHSRIVPGQTLKLADEAPGAAQAVASQVHVVSRGETLLKIAAVYGVRLAELLALNQLTPRTIIRPGQQILIPLPH
jgi:membrane-bound lytic murein transglycosylase D